MTFLDVYSWLASVHDARVFHNCTFCGHLQDERWHLLVDSAYPLSAALITLCRDNGHLTQRQKKFNTLRSLTRIVTERAFGLLKGKRGHVKYLSVKDLQKVPAVVTAAFVLHNVLLMQEGHQMENCEDDGMDGKTGIECQLEEPENTIGQRKWDELALLLV